MCLFNAVDCIRLVEDRACWWAFVQYSTSHSRSVNGGDFLDLLSNHWTSEEGLYSRKLRNVRTCTCKVENLG